jgi:hypothetical protein
MQHNTITDSAGIVWRVTDPTTGRAERVTPLPSRSALRRPMETVRYFRPTESLEAQDFKARLASIAADPWASRQLVHLLASNATDATAAGNELAREFPTTAPAARDGIVSAFMELRRRLS